MDQKTMRKHWCILIIMSILLIGLTTSGSTSPQLKQQKTPLLSFESTAVILSTDYLDSALSTIDLKTQTTTNEDIALTHGDDEIHCYNDKVYVLNRFSYNTIQVFDANQNFKHILDISTGEGSNPYDIGFISPTKAYITCYDSTDLLIINPSTGEHLGTIDFSEYADEDGIPEMHKMTSFKFLGMSRVYVTVQCLNRTNWFAPTDISYIVELNGDTDEIIRAIPLTGVNPTTDPIKKGQYIYIGETGSWFDPTDGGIERVHVFTNEAEGFFITEEQLGGNLVDFELYPKPSGVIDTILTLFEYITGQSHPLSYGYAIVSDISFNTSLVQFTDNTSMATEIFSTQGYNLADIAMTKKGQLFVADRSSSNPGVRIFQATTGEQQTSEPLPTGTFPPVHIVFL